MEPWTDRPLTKLNLIMAAAGEDLFDGARVLDVGFNAGYNAISLAQKYGCTVVGIDNNRLNLKTAEALCRVAGVRPDLRIEDAHTFEAEPFDVILHLGTLYHLQDPILAMRTASRNTKAGGALFLETVGYEGRDSLDCRLIYGLSGDTTNFWALGLGAIELILRDAGFSEVDVIRTFDLNIYEGTGLNRVLIKARKAD